MTAPDILAMLAAGGTLPTYWRRRRKSAKWHRGFRTGTRIVRSQCEKLAGLHKGNLLFADLSRPWPDPHCRSCERATPGSDAVREATALVARRTGFRSNANHRRPTGGTKQ